MSCATGDLSIIQVHDMPILRTDDEEAIRSRFENERDSEVRITLVTHNPNGGLFIPGRECDTCQTTQQALNEISALTPKLAVDTVDFYREPEKAAELEVRESRSLSSTDRTATACGFWIPFRL
jgi:hypothetical protein|tara:strand:+ start:6562 stop:6930 length:369 start_codon:yes stop_codon:yes gene_type:complete